MLTHSTCPYLRRLRLVAVLSRDDADQNHDLSSLLSEFLRKTLDRGRNRAKHLREAYTSPETGGRVRHEGHAESTMRLPANRFTGYSTSSAVQFLRGNSRGRRNDGPAIDHRENLN